ncbi:hypothetical protein F0562_029135 [Nyssa sinensis]|uniref:Uncharacterized protein n=1 Tax=Nyssa sinensis TaxID=561372 RepID=A0A5J5B4C0_9ASTE|nr:hypothetical protein F0562_029135 [Nyssa sinensis]
MPGGAGGLRLLGQISMYSPPLRCSMSVAWSRQFLDVADMVTSVKHTSGESYKGICRELLQGSKDNQ